MRLEIPLLLEVEIDTDDAERAKQLVSELTIDWLTLARIPFTTPILDGTLAYDAMLASKSLKSCKLTVLDARPGAVDNED